MRKYTITLLGDFKNESWIFDPLHHLKIFLLEHCNSNADEHVIYDIDDEVFEINDYFEQQFAYFIKYIGNGNNVIIDRLIEFIMKFCIIHQH